VKVRSIFFDIQGEDLKKHHSQRRDQ